MHPHVVRPLLRPSLHAARLACPPTLLSPLRPALPCASLVACLRSGRFPPRARGPVRVVRSVA
eukprot:11523143-Alexandrium_andersonii.AAC.1